MKTIFLNLIAAFQVFFQIIDLKKENSSAKILIKNNLKLSTAESCTGGLVSSLLTDVSGSSAYISANFVTYANEAKEHYLGVSSAILKEYGAVSAQTARAMIEGILENTDADYALATTGIAGPTGGSVEKPVGLVFIGVGNRQKIIVKQFNINPLISRRLVKIKFAKEAIKQFYEFLKENEKCTD